MKMPMHQQEYPRVRREVHHGHERPANLHGRVALVVLARMAHFMACGGRRRDGAAVEGVGRQRDGVRPRVEEVLARAAATHFHVADAVVAKHAARSLGAGEAGGDGHVRVLLQLRVHVPGRHAADGERRDDQQQVSTTQSEHGVFHSFKRGIARPCSAVRFVVLDKYTGWANRPKTQGQALSNHQTLVTVPLPLRRTRAARAQPRRSTLRSVPSMLRLSLPSRSSSSSSPTRVRRHPRSRSTPSR